MHFFFGYRIQRVNQIFLYNTLIYRLVGVSAFVTKLKIDHYELSMSSLDIKSRICNSPLFFLSNPIYLCAFIGNKHFKDDTAYW